jgi:hypothetical protein
MVMVFRSNRTAGGSRSRQWHLPVILLVVSAILLTGGCAKPASSSSAITVEHTITPDPPQAGAVVVSVKLSDTGKKPVSGAQVLLEADMSHAGMSPVFDKAKETGPGQYDGHLKLGMPGDWVVLLHVELPGGQKLEQQFTVDGVRSN